MKVLYRPKRSNLTEEMSEAKRFDSIDNMRIWVYSEWNADGKVFDLHDVEVDFTQEIPDEVETGWRHVHFVTIKRFGEEQFDKPQIIGYCMLLSDEQDLLGFHYQDSLGIEYKNMALNTLRQIFEVPPVDFDSMIGKNTWTELLNIKEELKPDDK